MILGNFFGVCKNRQLLLKVETHYVYMNRECERGYFSLINNNFINLRSALLISSISNLIFIICNLLPTQKLKPEIYGKVRLVLEAMFWKTSLC